MVSLPSARTAEVRQTQRRLLLISFVHSSSAGVEALGVAFGPVLAPALPPVCFSLPSSRPYCAYAAPPATSTPASASAATTSRRRAGRSPAGIPPGGAGGAGVGGSIGTVARPA